MNRTLFQAAHSKQYLHITSTHISNTHPIISQHALISPPHRLPNIPNTQPLIPPHTRRPPFLPKHAPINPNRKLRMPSHPPHLPPLPPLPPIIPHPTRHIIARAQQRPRQMRTPRHPPNRILMPRHHAQGALPRGADVECADEAVDACSGDDGGAVFVPVVGEGFRRGGGAGVKANTWGRLLWGGVDWDFEGEVVGGGGGGAEVEEAEVRVGGDGGEEGGGVRGEGCGVGAGVRGEGGEGLGSGWVPLLGGGRLVRVCRGGGIGELAGKCYDFDSAVPGAGAECIFSD